MTVSDILATGVSIIASLGGGAVIVFGCSTWLGKVWAERLMQRERQAHAKELEYLRDSLKSASEEELASLRSKLDIAKETHVKEHLDRVAIYKSAIDLIAEIVGKIEMILLQKRDSLTPEELHDFEVQRLRVYAYLAMHAPQSVMDAHDNLSDLILAVIQDNGTLPTWENFRDLAIQLLNAIRMDIGIRPDPIAYRGSR